MKSHWNRSVIWTIIVFLVVAAAVWFSSVPQSKTLTSKATVSATPAVIPKSTHVAPNASSTQLQNDFQTFLFKAQSALPAKASLRASVAKDPHRVAPELVAAGVVIGQIETQLDQSASLLPQAQKFFSGCVRNSAVDTAVRSLCLWHLRKNESKFSLATETFDDVPDANRVQDLLESTEF